MENTNMNLNLTVQQVNVILKYLGAGAYLEVAELIQVIRDQCAPQIQAAAAANPAMMDGTSSPPSSEPQQ